MKFIRSMKFALILLFLLLVACVIGSVQSQYDVYHTWWFITLAAALCVSLIACNLSRVNSLINHKFSCDGMDAVEPDAIISQSPEKLFEELGFKGNGYCVRNKIGIWGAWLTHLGILTIILGFGLGQFFTVKYTAYGVPGETVEVEGTNYELKINSFETILREDETVDQYISSLTMIDKTSNLSEDVSVSVNHPADAFGMKLYQNSTGWAGRVLFLKGEELLQDDVVCVGEAVACVDLPDLQLVLTAFYPDCQQNEDGSYYSASSQLNNPGWVYMIYYGESLLGMNVLTGNDKITVNDYSIIVTEPQQYTLIQLKHDPFTWLALLGGIIILIALFVAFYLRTEEILAVKDGSKWKIYSRSKKGGVLFKDKIIEAAKKYE